MMSCTKSEGSKAKEAFGDGGANTKTLEGLDGEALERRKEKDDGAGASGAEAPGAEGESAGGANENGALGEEDAGGADAAKGEAGEGGA